MARTMLCENDLPKHFWAEAVNTACYILNRVLLCPILNKIPYELWFGNTPRISYFKVFGCKCFILNTKDHLDKFDSKSDEAIFIGYSSRSKAYRVYNKRTLIIEESLHISFDENKNQTIHIENDDELQNTENTTKTTNNTTKNENLTKSWQYATSHPKDLIIGEVSKGILTRSKVDLECATYAFMSSIEPKNIQEACNDEY